MSADELNYREYQVYEEDAAEEMLVVGGRYREVVNGSQEEVIVNLNFNLQ